MKPILHLFRPQELRKIFRNEDTRFIVYVGLKVSGISLGISLFVYYFLFQVSRLNYLFFESQGFPVKDEGLFFDYIAAEVTKGIASASMETGVPISYGIITANTVEQAIDRAGVKAGNKGFEAAMSAVEMVNLLRAISQ